MNRNTAARTARIEDAAPSSAAPSSAAPGSAVPAFAAHSSALPDSTAPPELTLALLPEIPFCTSSDILLPDPLRPAETPSEEFRTLRTRLEQMQATRAIQTVLVASPSAGEGKSFTAANLALAQAQLADNPTLLCDFDLRNPILHRVFQIGRAPGISDYLLGKASLHQVVRRIENRNLFVLPAGEAAINPLELLHLKEVQELMGALRRAFRWIVLDSPPLLAASDANLLVALADGTLLVTRLGGTTIDAMGRAIESLGRPNLLGIVANCTGPSRL